MDISNVEDVANLTWIVVTTLVTIASILTAGTKTPGEDAPRWLRRIYRIVEAVGLVVGRAKEEPSPKKEETIDIRNPE